MPRLDTLSNRKSDLVDSMGLLIPDGKLRAALSQLIWTSVNHRREIIRPKRGKRLKPNPWNEVGVTFEFARIKFQIVSGFRETGLSSTLVDEFETNLPKTISYLINSMEIAKAEAPEPDNFPGEIISTKEKTAAPVKKSEQIREFIQRVGDSLNVWSRSR